MTIIAYKAFNKDWKCNNFQYEIGKKGLKPNVWYGLDEKGNFVIIEE